VDREARETSSAALETLNLPDEALAVTYPMNSKAVYLDRLNWARSYCKLGNVLESPKRGLFLMTALGKEIASLDDEEATRRLQEVDRQVRAARNRATKSASALTETEPDSDDEARGGTRTPDPLLVRPGVRLRLRRAVRGGGEATPSVQP